MSFILNGSMTQSNRSTEKPISAAKSRAGRSTNSNATGEPRPLSGLAFEEIRRDVLLPGHHGSHGLARPSQDGAEGGMVLERSPDGQPTSEGAHRPAQFLLTGRPSDTTPSGITGRPVSRKSRVCRHAQWKAAALLSSSRAIPSICAARSGSRSTPTKAGAKAVTGAASLPRQNRRRARILPAGFARTPTLPRYPWSRSPGAHSATRRTGGTAPARRPPLREDMTGESPPMSMA